MKQLTIRGFEAELEEKIREVARDQGTSLNRAALVLMRKGAGLGPPSERADAVGASLDKFIGVWSKQDEQEFLCAIESLEQVDPELWV